MKIDLSLTNMELYEDCQIQQVGGRLNLVVNELLTPNLVGRNLMKIVAKVPPDERQEVELTGPTAVWVYLIAFHGVVHEFKKVWYNDGKGMRILIAAHG